MSNDRTYLQQLIDTLPDSVVTSLAAAARGMVATAGSQPVPQAAAPAGPSQVDSPVAVFDAYLMVDWSASSKPSPPTPTSDTIWYALVERDAAGEVGPYLSATKPEREAGDHLSERRLADRYATGTQPVWKLFTAGSVGSQAIMGIPTLSTWRHDATIADHARLWPFETGLRTLERPGEGEWRILFAEIFPSLLSVVPTIGEVKDAAQVRTLARQLAELDGCGELVAGFAGPADLTAAERRTIELEEGWILDPRDDAVPGNGWRTRRR